MSLVGLVPVIGDLRTPAGGAQTQDGRVFVVGYGDATVCEALISGGSRDLAEGLSSPVGLVLVPDGSVLLTADWGNGAVLRILIG